MFNFFNKSKPTKKLHTATGWRISFITTYLPFEYESKQPCRNLAIAKATKAFMEQYPNREFLFMDVRAKSFTFQYE